MVDDDVVKAELALKELPRARTELSRQALAQLIERHLG